MTILLCAYRDASLSPLLHEYHLLNSKAYGQVQGVWTTLPFASLPHY